jgi:hypothetical protein
MANDLRGQGPREPTPESDALATAEQALRFKSDVWKEPIARWLGKRKEASVAEVLQGALGIAPQEQTHSAEIRVVKVLTDLGFTQLRPRKNGRRRRYRGESTETIRTKPWVQRSRATRCLVPAFSGAD